MGNFYGTLAIDYDERLLVLESSSAQPKFDGMRCQIIDNHLAQSAVDRRMNRSVLTKTCTRSGGYVPNLFVRACLDLLPCGLDGELVLADRSSGSGEAAFSKSMGALSRIAGRPDFAYMVYDYSPNNEVAQLPYCDRMSMVLDLQLPKWANVVRGEVLYSAAQLADYNSRIVSTGYEGTIVRRTDLPHVVGRSKRKCPAVMRIKAWADCEAIVLAVIPEVWNDCATNRALRPELIGKSKDYASSFLCEGLPDTQFAGQTFRAPLSVPDSIAVEYLANKSSIIGQLAKVRYLAAGVVDKPRLPVCVGLRSSTDIA